MRGQCPYCGEDDDSDCPHRIAASRSACARCGRPPVAEGQRLCGNCRGFDRTIANSFGLLGSEVRAVDGGWRLAWIVDGGFEGWLCPHTHASPEEAESCPERASVLTGPPKA